MRVASCIIILISLLSFMQSDAAAAKNKKWKQMKKDLKENISNLEAEFEDLMRLCVYVLHFAYPLQNLVYNRL